jgi:hypothetical protein
MNFDTVGKIGLALPGVVESYVPRKEPINVLPVLNRLQSSRTLKWSLLIYRWQVQVEYLVLQV